MRKRGIGIYLTFDVYIVYPFIYSNNNNRIVGAIAAGLFAAYLSHPFDTIKTCMQGDIERKKYVGVSDTGNFLCCNLLSLFSFFIALLVPNVSPSYIMQHQPCIKLEALKCFIKVFYIFIITFPPSIFLCVDVQKYNFFVCNVINRCCLPVLKANMCSIYIR